MRARLRWATDRAADWFWDGVFHIAGHIWDRKQAWRHRKGKLP